MTLNQAIDRYTNNAEYERRNGNLQGCLEFRQLAEWLKELKEYKEQEPCDNAISRNDMFDAVGHGTTYTSLEVQKIINILPSVNPVPCDDAVSRGVFEQVMWERDIAIEQLHELGYELGQKIEQESKVTTTSTDEPMVMYYPQVDGITPTVVKFEGTNMACMGGDEIMKEFENNIQKSCDEKVISLERAKKQIGRWIGYIDQDMINRICMSLDALPPVTPQPKTGHWTNNQNGTYECDKCGYKHSRSNYCPNCGAKMVEPQESEDKECSE